MGGGVRKDADCLLEWRGGFSEAEKLNLYQDESWIFHYAGR